VPEEDIKVIRDQFAATNDRDFNRAMEYYADDVLLVVPGEGIQSGRFEGKHAVGEWFGDWLGTWGSDYRFEIDEARMIRDLVFIHATHGGTGRVSGVEVRGESSYLYRVRDGKIVYVEFHWDRDEALRSAEAPGRSEGETD
jgi:ketosteroid isomerase-like protein